MGKILSLLIVIACVQDLYTQNWQVVGNPPVGANPVFQPNNNFLGSNAANSNSIKLGVTGSQDILIDNDASKLFPANPSAPTLLQGGHWIGLGRIFRPTNGVGANPGFAPKAHLHIHGDNQAAGLPGFGSGLRTWFNTGVLMSEGTDAMYVGMRSLATNQNYAVINWSDDAFGGTGSDFLSFNYTSNPGIVANQANTIGGQELGRFSPTPNSGTFGVGNFMFIGLGTEPVRRVEILDADPATGSNKNSPQLRLTYAYNANPANGVFSEFQTMANGHLYFNTRQNTAARFFGFHVPNPQNTVHINAVPGSPYFGTVNGSSGLRFSNLNSSHTPIANGVNGVNNTRVMTVDQNGDVVLVTPQGAPSTNNGITTLPANLPGGPAIQLGVDCQQIFTQPTLVTQATLQTDRFIGLNSKNLVFFDGAANAGRVGIGNLNGFCNVNNTLEVGADAASAYPVAGANGASGLRFTRLNSSHTPVANGVNGVNSTKVLTVDQNGDVVLTTPQGGGFSACNNLTPLTVSSGVDLNTFDIYFDGQGSKTNNTFDQVNVGYTCVQVPPAKFNTMYIDPVQLPMLPNVRHYAGFFTNRTRFAAGGGITPPTFPMQAGLFAESIGINNLDVFSVGGDFNALNARNCIGVRAKLSYINNNNNPLGGPADFTCAGLFYTDIATHPGLGNAPSAFNFGVYARAQGASQFNVGVFGATNGPSSGVQGMSRYAGYFAGDVGVVGNQYYVTSQAWSDSSIKTNVSNIENALTIINHLQPRSFYFDTANNSDLNLPSSKQYGFIAQQLSNALPEATSSFTTLPSFDTSGAQIAPSRILRSVNYNSIIGVLTAGMQAQQLSIDSLRGQNSNGAAVCNAISTNSITRWSGTDLCNSQLFDNGSNVGIGGAASNTLFRVFNTSLTSRSRAAELYTSLPGNSAANYGAITQAEGSARENTGLSTAAVNGGTTAASNFGLRSFASGASLENYGGLFVADQPALAPGSTNFGAYAQSTGAADINYGIFAKATGATVTNYAGYFDGDVVRTGNDNFTSDANLKENIDSLSGALGTLMQLKPKTFTYKQSSYPSMNLPGGPQYGLVAQDVQSLLPELVNAVTHPAVYDANGNEVTPAVTYLSLEYQQLTAIMIKAIQEQKRTIDSMKTVMAACCSGSAKSATGSGGISAIDVELSDAEAIVLNQNVPNPFAEQTTISYNIPKNVGTAQILFYDISGRQIKSVDITKKGKGQLNVFANDLSNGIYSYTLIADGKIIETRKMVKQQ